MTRGIGRTGVSHEDLQHYFDDELGGADARELAAQIEAHPELKAEVDQLTTLRGLVSEGLMVKSAEVPEARFAQVWDEIDREIERERRGASAPASTSIWGRLSAMLRPVAVPATAAAAAAALVVVVMTNTGDEGSSEPNNPGQVASVDEAEAEPSAEQADPDRPVQPQPDQLAAVPPTEEVVEFPDPKPAAAEIHTVEFNGRQGRISRTGTVTVLFVEEDEEPQDSERSL